MLTIILTTLISASDHPQLGVTVTSSEEGVKVTGISAGSPAAPFLEPGDRIVSLNGEAIRTEHGLAYVLLRTPPGQSVPVVIERAGVASTHAVMLPIPAEAPGVQVRYGQIGYQHEARPSTGLGLLIPGALLDAAGIGIAILAALVAERGEDDEVGLVYSLAGLSAAAFGAGIPMTIIGGKRHHRYRAWVADNGVAAAPANMRGFKLSMSF